MKTHVAFSIGNCMHREHHGWHARDLGRGLELIRFGHAGWPMIVFPTSMGSVIEYQDRGMVHAVADKIEAGQLQLICVATVDDESFYAKWQSPRARIDRYL